MVMRHVGGVDEDGAIEIGYGLAASIGGAAVANAAAALSDWMLAQPQVESVVRGRFSR